MPVRKLTPLEIRRREVMYHHARHWGELSTTLYTDRPGTVRSGRDVIDAEQFRLVATAFRELGQGKPLEGTLEKMKGEWTAFCEQNNRKVDEAPKIQRGPRAGQSVAEYKWSGPASIESNEIFIRNMYNSVKI